MYSTSQAVNITVDQNQIVCIEKGVKIHGNITVEGGVLCNKGCVVGDVFNFGGVIYNNDSIILDNAIKLFGGEFYNNGHVENGNLLISKGVNKVVNIGSMNLVNIHFNSLLAPF